MQGYQVAPGKGKAGSAGMSYVTACFPHYWDLAPDGLGVCKKCGAVCKFPSALYPSRFRPSVFLDENKKTYPGYYAKRG